MSFTMLSSLPQSDMKDTPTVYTITNPENASMEHRFHGEEPGKQPEKEPIPSTSSESGSVSDDNDGDEKLFFYDVYEAPPVFLTIVFALQQTLMSLSRTLSTSLLVAEVVCATMDEYYKARLLSTALFACGLTTLLQNTLGIRIPLYQGPSATYIVPLLAMANLPAWKCPEIVDVSSTNITTLGEGQVAEADMHDFILTKSQMLSGSLMIAGGIHILIGGLGLVGFLLRFIGPVTVIPALTITSIVVYGATVKFVKVQWGVAILTVAIAIILSFYLRFRNSPIPAWNRKKGFHIKWAPVHKMFSILTACLVGWGVSGILTAAGAFGDDPDGPNYFARTDSRTYVVKDTPWFVLPYPGQFGAPRYETGAFITFVMGTISSVIDSIGDYYACSKVCVLPPPPDHAVNRGIAVEGFMSFLAGWSGAGHATSTIGGNIGAIGITRVASLRVFQVVGIIFMLFGVVGKIGAVFITIPYSVLGGMMMINFGVLIGVMMSNMQFIDMSSTRNLGIIGMSMLLSLMLPHWIDNTDDPIQTETWKQASARCNLGIIGMSMLLSLMLPHWIDNTDDPIQTGSERADEIIETFLANPVFVAGVIACFLDNTIPGSQEERGMIAWRKGLGMTAATEAGNEKKSLENATKYERERAEKISKYVYTIPYADKLLKKFPKLRYIPFYPR